MTLTISQSTMKKTTESRMRIKWMLNVLYTTTSMELRATAFCPGHDSVKVIVDQTLFVRVSDRYIVIQV